MSSERANEPSQIEPINARVVNLVKVEMTLKLMYVLGGFEDEFEWTSQYRSRFPSNCTSVIVQGDDLADYLETYRKVIMPAIYIHPQIFPALRQVLPTMKGIHDFYGQSREPSCLRPEKHDSSETTLLKNKLRKQYRKDYGIPDDYEAANNILPP